MVPSTMAFGTRAPSSTERQPKNHPLGCQRRQLTSLQLHPLRRRLRFYHQRSFLEAEDKRVQGPSNNPSKSSKRRIAVVAMIDARHAIHRRQGAELDVKTVMRKITLVVNIDVACLVYDVNVMRLIRCFELSLRLLRSRTMTTMMKNMV